MLTRVGLVFIAVLLSGGVAAAQKESAEEHGWAYYYRLGLNEARHDQHDRAISSFTHAIEVNDRRADFFFRRGLSNQAASHHEDAIADFTEALRLAPTASPHRVAETYRLRANSHLQMLNPELAAADLEAFARHDPMTARRVFTAAPLEGEQLEALIGPLSDTVENNPESVFARMMRANAYLRLEDWRAAEEDLSHVLALEPDNANAHFQRAQARSQMGEHALAIEDFDALVAAELNLSAFLNARCWERAIWGEELDQAMDDCNRSIDLAPNAANYDSRGLVHLRQGSLDASIADYTAALEINPEQPDSYFGRGIAYLRDEQLSAGEADIARALELDPEIEAEFERYGVTR